MMFESRRPSTRWHRRTTALVPVFSAGLAAEQALRTSRAPAWRIRSAAIAAWLLLPVAAHGQERVPDLVEPGINEVNSHVTEAAVITSVGLDPGATTVGFSTSSHAGFDVFSAPLSGFPTEGSSFFVISSGSTASAPTPNNSGSTTTILEGLNTSVGTDLVSISFVMTPPEGAQCLSFDFKFFSEEFPEFVGGGVNDTFWPKRPRRHLPSSVAAPSHRTTWPSTPWGIPSASTRRVYSA